jgi:hypothetical protein
MRRAAIAVVVSVVGGYAFGGIGHQPIVRAATLTASARLPAQVRERSGTKTLEYGGYELSVPAGWPVYRLAEDPSQCVRYDVHAVYLGTPGPDQDCPAGLVGRTETISIGDPFPGARPAIIGQRVALGGRPGVISQDAGQGELGVALPPSAPVITATYGADPGLVERVLASIHEVVPQSARPEPVPPDAASQPPAIRPSPEGAGLVPGLAPAPETAGPSPTVKPAERPAERPAEKPAARPSATPTATAPDTAPESTAAVATAAAPPATEPMPGFDTCTAPSLPAMRAWRTKFAATAIYIGGEEMACDYGNLSAEWIKAAEAMGWSLLPTYVGPQASCNTFSGEITPKRGRPRAVRPPPTRSPTRRCSG